MNHTPDNALTSHSSSACPVCLEIWPESQTDDVTISHLVTHTARELAFALLATDARRAMMRLAMSGTDAHPLHRQAERFELHLAELIADRREPLTAEDTA